MRIIIPAAGLGSRFFDVGYTAPKPLIKARGEPMIRLVARMFQHPTITICQDQYEKAIAVETLGATIPIRKVTEGAALTVLCAEALVVDDEEIVVVNSDNLIDHDMRSFIEFARDQHCDGAMVTFEVTGGPWSYARLKAGDTSRVVQVAEKTPISNLATAGVYYFKSWRILRTAICRMVAANDRYNGEFYLAPAYNYLIGAGMSVLSYEIPEEQFISLGTPEDLRAYNESA